MREVQRFDTEIGDAEEYYNRQNPVEVRDFEYQSRTKDSYGQNGHNIGPDQTQSLPATSI
jgi:hypothetical protein